MSGDDDFDLYGEEDTKPVVVSSVLRSRVGASLTEGVLIPSPSRMKTPKSLNPVPAPLLSEKNGHARKMKTTNKIFKTTSVVRTEHPTHTVQTVSRTLTTPRAMQVQVQAKTHCILETCNGSVCCVV